MGGGETAACLHEAPKEAQGLQQPADHLAGGIADGGGNPKAVAVELKVAPAPVAAVAETGLEPNAGGLHANGEAAGGGKRDYVRWAPEEEQVFYAALRGVAGQKPEICLKEITAQLAGSKDYAQVRHYYYRLIKRLNRIMGAGATLDTKNPLQVHRSMIKFWEVVVDKGMRGTCLVGLMKKPRKQRDLSNTVQRSVAAVLKRTVGGGAAGQAAGSGAAGGGSRKRKPRTAGTGAAAAAVNGGGQEDVEMADVVAPPPAKQQRRFAGPSTRQQQQLEAAEIEVAVACGIREAVAVAAEGSSQSQTDGHEGDFACQQPVTSSQTAGSHPEALAQPPRASTAYSFRSTSNAGLSGAVLDGSMGQVGGKLRLQLVPVDASTAQDMAAASYHPFLELTLSTNKSLLSMLRHLGAKWQAAAPKTSSSEAVLFVHPPADGPIPLRGVCWGGPDCDSQLKVGDIYTTLHCPEPFQLLYSWGRPAGTAVPVAAGATSLPAKQISSRGALQHQRSAEADQLTAELRQAISAVAAATGQAAGAAAMPGHSQEQQHCPAPGSYLHLLQGSDAEDAMRAAQTAAEPSFGALLDGPSAVAPGGPKVLPRLDNAQQQPAARPLGVGGAGTPGREGQPLGGGGNTLADDAAGTPETGGARKPRGLLTLLQTSVSKPARRAPTKKEGPKSQRKPPRSSNTNASQRKQKGRQKQQQKQQEQQGGEEAPYGMPSAAGYAPYPWARMHPHLQAVPILQQLPVVQPGHQMPLLQQPVHQQYYLSQPAQHLQAAAGSHHLGPELGFGGDSLFQMLNSGQASPAADLPNLSMFGSPEKGGRREPSSVGPMLECAGDFSLKSWPTLSPPSNFLLPEGFDPGLSPGMAAPQAQAGGSLMGDARDRTAAAAAAASGLAGAAILGPTDFSLLMPYGNADAAAAAAGGPRQHGAAAASAEQARHQQPCAQPAAARQHQGQPQQGSGATAAVHQAADALFGSASLYNLLGAPTLSPEDGAAGPGAALPLMRDKDLADLTFDFGSLLGVGDAAASWLGHSVLPQQQPGPGGQQQPGRPAVVDRPFAALFGNT